MNVPNEYSLGYIHRANKTEMNTRSKTLQRQREYQTAFQSYLEDYRNTNVYISTVPYTVSEYIATTNSISNTTPTTTPTQSTTSTQSTISSANGHKYNLRRRVKNPNYVEEDFVYALDAKDDDWTPYVHCKPKSSIVDGSSVLIENNNTNKTNSDSDNNLALSSISPTHISSFIRRFHSSMMERDKERDVCSIAGIPTHRMILRSAGL